MHFSHPLMDDNISRSDLDDLIDYLRTDNPRLTHGDKVREFESEWSDWVGVKGSVMVNSGSSANDLSMDILASIRGKGEVIVPPLTWVSDIAAILRAGLTPRFVDITLSNLALDEGKVLEAVGPSTVGVFLTHILGLNGLTDSFISSLASMNIPLIEDCCESHGATHGSQRVGSLGWMSNFSFYYAHHLSTIEGGMICSNDEEILEQARMRRSHGLVREASENTQMIWKGNHPDLNPDFIFAYASHNMRPTELQGVLGLSQLPRLNSEVLKRRDNFKLFMELLDSEKFHTHFDTVRSSNYAFIVVLKEGNFELRDRIEKILREARIEFRRGLSGGGNQLRQPYLQKHLKTISLADFPVVEHVHHFGWYVGNYPTLTGDQISSLAATLNSSY